MPTVDHDAELAALARRRGWKRDGRSATYSLRGRPAQVRVTWAPTDRRAWHVALIRDGRAQVSIRCWNIGEATTWAESHTLL